MMNCQGFRENIVAYLDRELESAPSRDMDHHLDQCDTCREQLGVERGLSEFLRTRLQVESEVPAGLRETVLETLRREAATEPETEPSWWVRALGSSWTPRFAMAAVIAVLLLVPVHRFLNQAPAFAIAAGERHGCHVQEPGAALPACCKDLGLGVGDLMGSPSANVPVPDLEEAGLVLVRTTRCSFADRVVNLISYRDDESRPYSLLLTDQETQEFDLMPRQDQHGVSQVRRQVRIDDDLHGVHESFEIAIWRSQDLVYTCVGPQSSRVFAAALEALQVGR